MSGGDFRPRLSQRDGERVLIALENLAHDTMSHDEAQAILELMARVQRSKAAAAPAAERAGDDLPPPGQDYPLGIPCPACRRREVEYNGSYFCRFCRWGLGEENVQPWLRALIRLRRSRGEDTSHAERYLERPLRR